MSEVTRVICDHCDMIADAKKADYSIAVPLPEGWHRFAGKHLCSYGCVIAYCQQQQAAATS